jgi:hypothetical protein
MVTNERARRAFDRIERAIERIEDRAGRLAEAATRPRNDEELERLRSAHLTLRRQVQGAIGEIDRLLQDRQAAAEPEPAAQQEEMA